MEKTWSSSTTNHSKDTPTSSLFLHTTDLRFGSRIIFFFGPTDNNDLAQAMVRFIGMSPGFIKIRDGSLINLPRRCVRLKAGVRGPGH